MELSSRQLHLNGAIEWGFASDILRAHEPGSSVYYIKLTTDQAIELHKQWTDQEKEWFYHLCEDVNYHCLPKFLQRNNREGIKVYLDHNDAS